MMLGDDQISITLTGWGAQTAGIAAFRPGDFVQGAVQITPEKDLRCRHFWVRLRWHTEGRGDRDEGLGAEQDLYQGHLKAGVPVTYSFHLRAPDEPWSYAGHYIQIVWEIAASVDVPLGVDPKGSLPFILALDEG